ncbi:MAG: hypothetical protein Q9168_005429 [Polycauliona sp. 1 TL-2023]
MDRFGWVGLVAQLSRQVISSQQPLLVQRLGRPLGTFVSVCLRDTANRYVRIENEVLNGNEKEVLAFKQSVTDECNMTAIAGAIIAQIAMTALSLPDLNRTHWVARALFLLGVTTGCLSVYYACELHRVVSKFYRPDAIRFWLRAPPPRVQDGGFDDRPRTSLQAVLSLWAPFAAVQVSIFSLILGLAVYQGFLWTRDKDSGSGQHDNRDVFITAAVGTGAYFVFFRVIFTLKDTESLLRTGWILMSENPGTQLQDQQVDPAATNSSISSMIDAPAFIPTLPSVEPLKDADGMVVADLVAALKAAAQAQMQCAEANHRVAVEYAKISLRSD